MTLKELYASLDLLVQELVSNKYLITNLSNCTKLKSHMSIVNEVQKVCSEFPSGQLTIGVNDFSLVISETLTVRFIHFLNDRMLYQNPDILLLDALSSTNYYSSTATKYKIVANDNEYPYNKHEYLFDGENFDELLFTFSLKYPNGDHKLLLIQNIFKYLIMKYDISEYFDNLNGHFVLYEKFMQYSKFKG